MVQRQRQRLWQLIAPMSEISARYRAGQPATQQRLTEVSQAFLHGLRQALAEEPGSAPPGGGVSAELRPFALEGVGAGALMSDRVQRRPWADGHLGRLLADAAEPVATMYAIGAGWALARLRQPRPTAQAASAAMAEAMNDGYGFHEGLFHGYRFASPRRFPGASEAFDRGLGRSLWFIRGGESGPIAEAIAGFGSPRQFALWSGVGVAAAFTGGVTRAALGELAESAGERRSALAEGVCLARKLRSGLDEELPRHTEMAVATLC